MKLTGRRNQCPGCSEYFNSLTAFDAHRVGEFGLNSYNENILPFPQMHYEHLYKRIHSGNITDEQQQKIAKSLGSHKVDPAKYPQRLFPKISDWSVYKNEPDVVFEKV